MTSNERFEDTQKARSPVKIIRHLSGAVVVVLMLSLVLVAPSVAGTPQSPGFSAVILLSSLAAAGFIRRGKE